MSRKPLYMYGTSRRGQQYIKKSNQIQAREMFSEEEQNERDVIIIPNGVRKIEKGNLKVCNEYVKKVILPDSVKEIGDFVFYGYTSLQEIVLPNSLEKIGRYAFDSCRNLKEIIIPHSVEEIVELAFNNCTSLQKVILPGSLQIIEYGVFYGCTSLQEIVLPDSIRSIKVTAFGNCASLQKIICCSSNLEIHSEDLLNKFPQVKEVLVPTTEIKERFRKCLAKLKVYDANIQVVDTEQLMAIYKNQTKELNNTFVNNSQKLSKSNKSYNGIIRKNLLKRK